MYLHYFHKKFSIFYKIELINNFLQSQIREKKFYTADKDAQGNYKQIRSFHELVDGKIVLAEWPDLDEFESRHTNDVQGRYALDNYRQAKGFVKI